MKVSLHPQPEPWIVVKLQGLLSQACPTCHHGAWTGPLLGATEQGRAKKEPRVGWRGCHVYGAGNLRVGNICSETQTHATSTARGRSSLSRPFTPQNLPQEPQASHRPWADLNQTQRQSRAGKESQWSRFLQGLLGGMRDTLRPGQQIPHRIRASQRA